ncbi:MAG: PAS domain S-box protein [Methanomassiliicoccales archaeon]|jgi:PAS domain S-box-containing protein
MVDDEPVLLEASKQFLELDPNITVDTTLSALEALELMKAKKHDVVVSDYQMPDMDGIRLLREIRSKGNEIPFILFTGKGREEVVMQALNSGADFYLQKGGDFRGQFAELVNMMSQAVQRRRSDQALRDSEERYHRLFDNIGIGVVVYEATDDGSDFIIRDFNRGAQNIEKVRKQDVVGHKVTEVFPGIRDMNLLDVFRRVYQTGNPESHPISLYRDERMVGYRENYVYRLPSGEVVTVYEDATARKESEARIEHLASFPSLNPDPILELKSGGHITYANASAYRIVRELGHPDDPSLLLPEDIEEVINALKTSGAGRTIREVELDGKVIQASILNVIGTDLVRVYETDITERKRVEKVLRASEARFEQLAEHVGVVTWEVDPEGLYTYVSRVSETVWGYRPDEVVGKMHFYDLTPEAERESLKTVAFEVFKARERFVGLENSIATKDGRTITVLTNGIPLLNTDGMLRGYQGTDTDITERKKAEQALRDSERKYRLLAENVNDVIWIMDIATQRFTYVSPSVEKLSGFTVEETLQKSLKDVLHPDSYAEIEEHLPTWIKQFLHGEDAGRARRFTTRQRGNDGTWIDAEVVATLLQDCGGEFSSVLGVTRDVTDRVKAEQALREANRKLNLLSNVTRHDIKNQLTLLMGNLALLQRQHSGLRSEDRFLQAMDAARRISSMIDLTKEYEEIGVLSPFWQNLRGLVDSGAAEVATGSIRLLNDLPSDVEIYADPLISKVFHNLVDNAVRHGGTVTKIRFYSMQKDGPRDVVCEDDGVGISADLKEKIFTYSSAKNHGLFLSKEILSITGVTITEAGEPGKGAKFVLTLPPEGYRKSAKS